MEFRIGLNLGDGVEEGDNILGEGINVSARVQSLADAGGICISGIVYDPIKNKLAFSYDYVGEYQLVLRSSPSKTEVASKEKMVYPLPDVPSIAVLPFVSMSQDPKQEFLCDGMTEAIITALSKVPTILVTARNSTFTYKGKAVKVKQVSEELGVQYVLEGSLRRSGDRLRITAHAKRLIYKDQSQAERYNNAVRKAGLK